MHHMEIDVEGDEKYKIELVHYTQKKSWDCGLSCVMMVLPKIKRDFFNTHFDEICKKEGFDSSTWTIDLCYLLKSFSIKFIYYTTVIGVNPDHKSHFFYEKIIHKDKDRVSKRFSDAEKNGIDIRVKSVETKELIGHIKNYGPIILLTNAGFLTCEICKTNNTTAKLINFLPKAVTYHGHYVVLCGYDLKKGHFFYRNPACTSRTCEIQISTMNNARLCRGTDEDCIFIFQ